MFEKENKYIRMTQRLICFRLFVMIVDQSFYPLLHGVTQNKTPSSVEKIGAVS